MLDPKKCTILFQCLTRDSVTVTVDAVVFFRIENATVSITNVKDAQASTRLLAQTTLRNMIGTRILSDILTNREDISLQMQVKSELKTLLLFFKSFSIFNPIFLILIWFRLHCGYLLEGWRYGD